jgi:hypothetical protein
MNHQEQFIGDSEFVWQYNDRKRKHVRADPKSNVWT